MNAGSLSDEMLSASCGLLCLDPWQLKCRVGVAGASTLPEELGSMMDDMAAPGSDTPIKESTQGPDASFWPKAASTSRRDG